MNTHQPTPSSSIKRPYKHQYASKSILIIETTGCLAIPMTFFPAAYKIESAVSLKEAKIILQEQHIDLIAFNVSCPESMTYQLMEMVNSQVKNHIIPLLLVIDLSHTLTTIPGTTWGGKLGIVHSLSSRGEFIATLARLFDEMW